MQSSKNSVEKTVVGMCIQRAEALGDALAVGLRVTDFADPECASLFGAIVEAERENRPYNLAALGSVMPTRAVELVELVEAAPISQDAGYYAREVVALSAQRAAMKGLMEAYRAVSRRQPFASIADAITAARQAVEDATAPSIGGPKSINEVLDSLMRIIERRATAQSEGKQLAISTGIKILDLCLGGGWHPGRLYVPAGRPGMGKTAFAMAAAKEAAFAGHGVAVFTLEMPSEELTERALSSESMVSSRRLAVADLTDDEINRVFHAADKLHKLPMWFDDSFRGDVDAMIASCRRLKRQGRINLVIVDYIQLLNLPGRWQSRVHELSAITMRLKLMAIDLKVPVLALSAINRTATKMDDNLGPGVEHLKDSGSIEQDADAVVILHRQDDDDGKVWFNIAKNRQGPQRRFPVAVDMSLGKFSDLNLNTDGL